METLIRAAVCFILVIASQGQDSFDISFDGEGFLGADASYITTEAIKTEVILRPNFVNFGEVERGKTLVKTLKLIGVEREDLCLEQAETSEDYFVTSISANEMDNQAGFKINFVLKADAPIGLFTERMILHTNSLTKSRISVPIYGNIVGKIRVKPKVVLLGVIDKGSDAISKLEVASVNKKKFNILKVISDSPFLIAEVTQSKNGCEYEIALRVDEDAPIGSMKGKINIKTNDSDQSLLEVFVYGLVTKPVRRGTLSTENSHLKYDSPRFEHIYITQPPIEEDTYLSAWLIKRFLDPNAEFVFVPIDSLVPDKTGHIFDLPSSNARWIRNSRRCTSENLLDEVKQQNPAIKSMVNLVRQIEMGSWLVSPNSEAGRLRSTITEMTNGTIDPQLRIHRVFTYFDDIYAAGGYVPE